ncbi:unnamed protein product [Cochlearia groenlandica]
MRFDWVLGMKHNEYKEETCQFLATLQISHTEPRPQGIRVSYAGDNGRTYDESLDAWERILGIPTDGQAELTNEPGESVKLWNFITNGVYQPGRSKSALIRHPAIRYVQ